jgi:hypothetical protein
MSVEGGLGEVRRRNEHDLVVCNHGFGMEHPCGAIHPKRSGVEEDDGPPGSWPVQAPKPVGEPPHHAVLRGRIASLALDVQQERRLESWLCIHPSCENFESPPPDTEATDVTDLCLSASTR